MNHLHHYIFFCDFTNTDTKHSKFYPLTQISLSFNTNNTEQFDRENGILPRQRKLAEIVEMIHTASLLHDDVSDHADTRRGKPSGNIVFTNKTAVLADYFLLDAATVTAYKSPDPQVIEIMSSCIASPVEGEFMQLHNIDEHDSTTTKNKDMINVNEVDEAFWLLST